MRWTPGRPAPGAAVASLAALALVTAGLQAAVVAIDSRDAGAAIAASVAISFQGLWALLAWRRPGREVLVAGLIANAGLLALSAWRLGTESGEVLPPEVLVIAFEVVLVVGLVAVLVRPDLARRTPSTGRSAILTGALAAVLAVGSLMATGPGLAPPGVASPIVGSAALPSASGGPEATGAALPSTVATVPPPATAVAPASAPGSAAPSALASPQAPVSSPGPSGTAGQSAGPSAASATTAPTTSPLSVSAPTAASPTGTSRPAASPSPRPSATPRVTVTPTAPRATPRPVATPTAAPVATPAPTPKPTQKPTPKPTPPPTNAPTQPPVVGGVPGRITFGTDYDPETLAIISPTTTIHRGELIAWRADLTEPAGSTTLTFTVTEPNPPGPEFPHWQQDFGVPDPSFVVLVNKVDLSVYVHGDPGNFIMRIRRGQTVLAQGSFRLVP